MIEKITPGERKRRRQRRLRRLAAEILGTEDQLPGADSSWATREVTVKYVDIEKVVDREDYRHLSPSITSRLKRKFTAFENRIASSDYEKRLIEQYNSCNLQTSNWSPYQCLQLNNIFLMGKTSSVTDLETSTIFTGLGIAVQTSFLNKHKIYIESQIRKHKISKTFGADRKYVYIDQPGLHVYGHGLIDIAPRVDVARRLLGTDCVFLVRPAVPWMEDMLRSIGVNRENTLILDDRHFWSFERLYIPFTVKRGFAVDAEALRKGWRSFIGQMKLPARAGKPLKKRLFVSRQYVSGRPVARNEDELFAIAGKYGFERIHPQQLTFQEQIQLFSQAEYVAGEDGSGLHNALFARKGKGLFVYMKPDRENLWHLAIAQAARLDLHAIKCQGTEADYWADPEAFATMLARGLS